MRHRLPLERLPHCYATLRQKAWPAAPTEPAPLCGEYRVDDSFSSQREPNSCTWERRAVWGIVTEQNKKWD